MTKANECTCPSGDGSLRHPCPAHPASVELAGVAAELTFINGRPAMCGCQVEYSSGGGEYSDVIYVTLCAKHSGSAILDLMANNRIALTPEYEGQWHADLYLDREIPLAKADGATPAEAVLALMSAERIDPEQESVEQAGGDERAVDGKPRATKCPDCGEGDLMPGDLCACGYETDPAAGYACSECDGSGDGYVGEVCRECDGSGWFVTPEQARAALAQPSPKCEFCGGTGEISGVEGEYDWVNGPCPRCAYPAQAQAEQAEAERPEAVAWRYGFSGGIVSDKACLDEWKSGGEYQSLMTVAQHERIVGELRAENERLANDRDRANQFANGAALEINAALARVAELETLQQVDEHVIEHLSLQMDIAESNASSRRAQAQHSVPEELRAICMLVAETGIKYGRGRHRAVASDECRAVVNAVLNADLSVGRACEYAGCCDKAHPGTSLCIAHHSKKAREQLLAAAPGKEVGHE
ncbi:TPA: hypothetical protein L4E40_000537 [Pseudomonas aeruginosa]|uniref:hypothetical protein n=1 Tax=Pseudomonas aeruginosa TaxID=287 RepID=UPI001573A172|nr:hypothetical protein [Pseudomonas aeruginosa]NTS86953.1 hypothetical protein [Pseudomonas aeruginosa]HBO0937060.1 hypothetical protein [Pseudomonas aeruginosa]